MKWPLTTGVLGQFIPIYLSFQFLVFLFLCVCVCSCLCMLQSLKPKEILFVKVKAQPHLPKTLHSNMPRQIYIGLWGQIHCPNVYAKKEAVTFILVVVLSPPVSLCCGDTVFFIAKAKLLCLAFQKRTQLENSG